MPAMGRNKMNRKIYPLMVGALLAFGALTAFGPPAPSAPLLMPVDTGAGNPKIIPIAKWDRERHGSRCEYRRGECRHFHRGFYYETPWWTLPFAVDDTIGSRRYYDGDYDYYDITMEIMTITMMKMTKAGGVTAILSGASNATAHIARVAIPGCRTAAGCASASVRSKRLVKGTFGKRQLHDFKTFTSGNDACQAIRPDHHH
jgi:hypothetical protein